jgi:hypothetical protein
MIIQEALKTAKEGKIVYCKNAQPFPFYLRYNSKEDHFEMSESRNFREIAK